MREAQRGRVLATRAAKGERHRRRRQGRRYHPWRHQPLRRDQQEVAQRLAAGRIDLVTVCGWGFVGSFLCFLEQLQFFALLDVEGTGFQRVMIPIARVIMTYQLKILLGIGSINLVPAKLFREIALLRLIGYTTMQLRAGFCQRGNLTAGPMHQNTLADAVERLSAEELAAVLNGTARRLAARGYLMARTEPGPLRAGCLRSGDDGALCGGGAAEEDRDEVDQRQKGGGDRAVGPRVPDLMARSLRSPAAAGGGGQSGAHPGAGDSAHAGAGAPGDRQPGSRGAAGPAAG